MKWLWLFLAAVPQIAAAATSCAIPDRIATPRVERPDPREIRQARIDGYTLALSWSPQFCRDRGDDPGERGQCGREARFGFVLHGLWPDGQGRNDPAWCAAVDRPIPADTIRRNFCMTPSANLLQHEWAKHGTCMTRSPDAYFRSAAILYNVLKWPDMDALSRQRPTTGAFAEAFARTNPGVRADAIRIDTTEGGWLREVKICLGKNFRPRRCPAGRASDPRRALKIWRRVP